MVGVSFDQKPYRRAMMETWGAKVHRSPSDLTEAGRSQAEHESGSLGIAISEAVELAVAAEDTHDSLGSVLGHVRLHQTVIGQESIRQLELAGEYPDVVIGCVGGGSNFAGVAFPFIREKLREGKDTRFLAAEPAACPTLTQGVYAYDFGDTVGMTPLMPMYTLGHDFVPPPVHAGGLRYDGDSPRSARSSRRESSSRSRSSRPTCSMRRVASRAPRAFSRAGAVARDPRRDRAGGGGEAGGRRARDPVQPVRPRPLRHGGLRRLSPGRTRGPGVLQADRDAALERLPEAPALV